MPDDKILVLMPVFNDWAACDQLLTALDGVLAQNGLSAAVLLVDDGSSVAPPPQFAKHDYRSLWRIDVLRLRRNLGHQRAICVGLCHVEACPDVSCEAIVLMDSDGEDDPRDVPRLVRKFREQGGGKIVFAQRTKRSESLVFRLCYRVFRLLHWLLTSQGVQVGNFSVLSRAHLRSLAVSPELWNHYAAAVRSSRLPRCEEPTVRGKRLAGEGRMNFARLVIHGLSAIAVFSDVVGVRLLLAAVLLTLVALAGAIGMAALRLWTDLTVSGWAMFAGGLLLVVLLQAVMLTAAFSFLVLAGRQTATFLPVRDSGLLVDRIDAVYIKPCPSSDLPS